MNFRKYQKLTGRKAQSRVEEAESKQGASSAEVLSVLSEIHEKLRDNGAQLKKHSDQLDAQRQAGHKLMNGMYVPLHEFKQATLLLILSSGNTLPA